MAADVERLREQGQRIKELRRLKERRDGASLSQETAAHEIGVSARTYRTWEGSGAVIQYDNLKRLADYYGTSTDYIERGEATATPDPFAGDVATRLTAIEKELRGLREAVDLLAARQIPDATTASRAARQRRSSTGRRTG